MAFNPDLTTEYIAYIVALKTANTTKLDVNTLIVKDRPNVIAGTLERADENTMLMEYLD